MIAGSGCCNFVHVNQTGLCDDASGRIRYFLTSKRKAMIKYVLKQNHNEKSAAYGKYYAFPVVDETMDLEALARHMEEHNTGFSEAMCVGVMKAMVKCIKEQLLAGKNVKIDNLAIFSCGIKNREGAVSPEEFTVVNNISGVKLRARATGTLSNANLNLAVSIKKANTMVGVTVEGGGHTTEGGGSNTQGSNPSGSNTGGGTGNQGGGTGGGSQSTGGGDTGDDLPGDFS